MGRTAAPFSAVLEGEKARFGKLRRALRKEDQRRFDDVFDFVHENIQAGVQQSDADPFEAMLILMLIGMMRKIETIEKGTAPQATLFSE